MAIRKKKSTGSKSEEKIPVKKTEAAPARLLSRGLAPFEEIERLFDDYFHRNWLRSFRPEFPGLRDLWGTYEMHSPSMDIVDRDKEIVVRAELPGVDKKDLDVSVSDDVLTIKASSSMEAKEEKENYYRSEIRKGAFSRSVGLPADVDSSKIEAVFKNGVLELKIPKTAKSKAKKVKVS